MNSTDLAFTSALDQARLIKRGEITPLHLVNVYLERIGRYDGQLGSFVTVMAESAIAQAEAMTHMLKQQTSDAPLPPLFGVPITIKDLHPVANVPCAMGVSALKNRIADVDDGIVTRLRNAGLILLGKTATSQLGSLPYTEPPGFQPTRNPWNLDYTAGGSSGGAAAAIAAGLSPLAQGSDAGGSIRGPAFCCGLVGIKPSRGRVSCAPVGEYLSGIAAIGPLARTVADAAALLDTMAGYTTGDPYWLPDPHPSFQAIAESERPSPRKLRIAIATEIPNIAPAETECAQAVEETARRLENLGHDVEVACPQVADLIEPFTLIWKTGVALSGLPAELLDPMNQWLLAGCGTSGEYLRAVGAIQVIARRIVQFFDSFDVLVLPTYLHAPIAVGAWAHHSPAETLTHIIRWIAPCPPFNATGQPAIALPVGFTPNGLPVGVQLVGRPADEATLIRLAADLEAAYPWAHLRPAFATESTD